MYYIVSKKELPEMIVPEVPKYYATMSADKKKQKYETNEWGDAQTKRIVLGSSIDSALQAAYLQNTDSVIVYYGDYYVYRIDSVDASQLRKPTKVEEPLVQVASIMWYTGNLRPRQIGKISAKEPEKFKHATPDQINNNATKMAIDSSGQRFVYQHPIQWNWISKS